MRLAILLEAMVSRLANHHLAIPFLRPFMPGIAFPFKEKGSEKGEGSPNSHDANCRCNNDVAIATVDKASPVRAAGPNGNTRSGPRGAGNGDRDGGTGEGERVVFGDRCTSSDGKKAGGEGAGGGENIKRVDCGVGAVVNLVGSRTPAANAAATTDEDISSTSTAGAAAAASGAASATGCIDGGIDKDKDGAIVAAALGDKAAINSSGGSTAVSLGKGLIKDGVSGAVAAGCGGRGTLKNGAIDVITATAVPRGGRECNAGALGETKPAEDGPVEGWLVSQAFFKVAAGGCCKKSIV